MAKLKPLIDQSIEEECKKRNLIKLKYMYYFNIDKVYDGIIYFNMATYKDCRSVTVYIGVCHKEEERLKIKFMNNRAAAEYKKKWLRWPVEEKSLAALMDVQEKKQYGFGFLYYDEHPELIQDTTAKMFELIDKYAMDYIHNMADVDVIIYSYLHEGGHFYFNTIQDVPFLFLISGRRDKAVSFIEEKLRDMPDMEDWLKDFCHKFLAYDYDADPDKLPVA